MLRLILNKAVQSILLFQIFGVVSCNNKSKLEHALMQAGENRKEIEEVINFYKKSGDRLKLKAAYYLVENLPYQYHYSGKAVDESREIFRRVNSIVLSGNEFNITNTGDSIADVINDINFSSLERTKDIHLIKASFLIKNIEDAFKAWQYPWAKKMNFKQFCEYILPYKVRNEAPDNWRSFFQEKYKWLRQVLKDSSSALEASILINNDLKKWFYFSKVDFFFDPSFSDLMLLRAGRCPEEVQITTYAMRAMGIPVSYDYVLYWANRNNGHEWNSLHYNNKTIPFLGTEIDPGDYKIEFAMPGSLNSKRAKIFRRTYEPSEYWPLEELNSDEAPAYFNDKRFLDVTKQYVPVTDVSLKLEEEAKEFNFSFLCVFNNRKWQPVHWGRIKNLQVTYSDMGRGIVYMPSIIDEGNLIPCGVPFVLKKDGTISLFKADKSKGTRLVIDRKYPSGDDNKIEIGNKYELFYWDNSWISLGRQIASSPQLVYEKAPLNALFWIRNVNKGQQERIFTNNNGKIIWW